MTLEEALAASLPTERLGYRGAKIERPSVVYVCDDGPLGRRFHREFLEHNGVECSAPMLNVTLPACILERDDWEPMRSVESTRWLPVEEER